MEDITNVDAVAQQETLEQERIETEEKLRQKAVINEKVGAFVRNLLGLSVDVTKTEETYENSKSADMSLGEKMELLASALTEDKTNKGDDGEVFTKPVIEDGVIVYKDSGERMGSGTYDDPMQFVDGDSVEAGKYYCRCKIDSNGKAYRQLTSGTYKCIYSQTAPKWGAMTAFEFAY